MSATRSAVRRPEEPVRSPAPELALCSPDRVRRLGRLRVPLAIGQRPWATAYRLPNGRVVWCVRLRQDGEVVRTVVSTATLRQYARGSRLPGLLAEIAALVGPEVRECRATA
jgi:hypothetical protein